MSQVAVRLIPADEDSWRLDAYLRRGGYEAARKALTSMAPAHIIAEVRKAGLRGRGGAGFPAGLKLQACRQVPAETRYIVANGSEGDPEIGMHKSFLESDPHAVIEGMAIAGYAVGAEEGYIY